MGGRHFGGDRRRDDHHRLAAPPSRRRSIPAGCGFFPPVLRGPGHVAGPTRQSTEVNTNSQAVQRSRGPLGGQGSFSGARPGRVEADAGRGGCGQPASVRGNRAVGTAAPAPGVGRHHWAGVHRPGSTAKLQSARTSAHPTAATAALTAPSSRESAQAFRPGRGLSQGGERPEGVRGPPALHHWPPQQTVPVVPN